MATITVRNLDDEVQRRLKVRAATHNRSMEAEARVILSDAVAEHGFAKEWVDLTWTARGPELELPERSMPRELNPG